MVIKKFQISGLIFGLFCLICLGCSVPVRSYLWNTSSEPQIVVVSYNSIPKADVHFYYGDATLEPTYKLKDKLKMRVSAQQIEACTYEVKIPPHSIVFLEQSLNFRSLSFKSVKIGNKELVAPNGLYEDSFLVKKSINKYTIWFRIE